MHIDSLVVDVNIGRWLAENKLMILDIPISQLALRHRPPVDSRLRATRGVEDNAMPRLVQPVDFPDDLRKGLRLIVAPVRDGAYRTVDVETVRHFQAPHVIPQRMADFRPKVKKAISGLDV